MHIYILGWYRIQMYRVITNQEQQQHVPQPKGEKQTADMCEYRM
jgi:hypothetical protein